MPDTAYRLEGDTLRITLQRPPAENVYVKDSLDMIRILSAYFHDYFHVFYGG